MKNIENYIIKRYIGSGGTGKVYLGINQTTSKQVAIKIILRKGLTKKAIESAEKELALLQLLDHPNLIEFEKVVVDEDHIYLVTEFISGGDLDHIHPIEFYSNLKSLFKQIVEALAWCHSHHICHRDLKPSNILIDKERKHIKIADFGMATIQQKDQLLKSSCGSPHYASPEIIKGIPYNGTQSDIWSLGVLLYIILIGKVPFEDRHMGRLLSKIKSGKFKPIPDWVSKEEKDLILKMLTLDPNKRITANEILFHPWLFSIPNLNLKESSHEFNLIELNDINRTTLETLKVLWRNMTHDQIINTLLDKKSNIQKTIFHLLIKKQQKEKPNLIKIKPISTIEKQKDVLPPLIQNIEKKSKFQLGLTLHHTLPQIKKSNIPCFLYRLFYSPKEFKIQFSAGSEFNLSCKLHEIFLKNFKGNICGYMYSNGKTIWVGKIDLKTLFHYTTKRIETKRYELHFFVQHDLYVFYQFLNLIEFYDQELDFLMKSNGLQ